MNCSAATSATRAHLFVQDFEADQYADQSNAGFSPQLADAQASPWPALQLAIAQTIYYLGFLLLPVLLFWVGLSREDLLHGLYLALLLIYFLPSSLSLEPSVKAGAISWRQVNCAEFVILRQTRKLSLHSRYACQHSCCATSVGALRFFHSFYTCVCSM